jgi:hypothetical protein
LALALNFLFLKFYLFFKIFLFLKLKKFLILKIKFFCFLYLLKKQKYFGGDGDRTNAFPTAKLTLYQLSYESNILLSSNKIHKVKKQNKKLNFLIFFRGGTPMILVSFFFSHRALFKNLSRNGTALKVTKFGDTNRQTNKQTDRHFLFNIRTGRPSAYGAQRESRFDAKEYILKLF